MDAFQIIVAIVILACTARFVQKRDYGWAIFTGGILIILFATGLLR